MKRLLFIKGIFAALLLPLHIFSKNRQPLQLPVKGFKIAKGEARIHGHLTLKGVNANILDLKVSGKDTDGGVAIFEQISVSKGKGTPLHIHHSQNELFFVEEGKYFFKVGEETFHLSEGDSIFLPQKVPHAWTQISEKGKMVVMFQPAGKMENFFVTVAGLDHEPSQEEMAQIFEQNEMTIVGPPLKPA